MRLPLNAANLAAISQKASVPNYDRRSLRPNVAHFGVGAFHRSHQAAYLEDILRIPHAERWSECGIGLRASASDARLHSLLAAQDGMYTLIERSADSESARVVGSIVQYVRAHRELERTLELLASPEIRIVTLTVTESGYFTHPATGDFEVDHPAIRADVNHPHSPSTVIGILAEALDRRRREGVAPFAVLSCDNVQHNGRVLKGAISRYARMRQPELGAWIEQNVSFPNCMVDRITPATTQRDIENVAQRFGIEAGWPVITEPFRQWVIEDKFPNGRPPWELLGSESGILFTSDVTPYEQMKMRLLNGGHSALAYLGLLMQYEQVHELIADPLMLEFLGRYFDEVSPVVPEVPGVDLAVYKQQLVERFANHSISDSLVRVAGDGSSKLTKWTMPSISELHNRQLPFESLALIIAAWYQYLLGSDEQEQEISIVDSRKSWLLDLVARPDSLNTFLHQETLFTEDLRQSKGFHSAVVRYVDGLQHEGARFVLTQMLRRSA